MSRRPFTFRELVLAFLMLGVILGVGGWFAILVPLYESWKEKVEDALVQEHLLNENLKILAQKEAIERRYAEFTDKLKVKGSDEQEISRLQDEVSDLARQTQVKVNKTKPRPLETKPDFKRCLIELDCEGTILQLSDFIYRMQLSPQVLRVEQLRLSLESQKESILRASLLVSKILILE